MESSSTPRLKLASLPVELLHNLEPFCDHRQLAALARLSHHFHDIFNPLLYQYNAFKEAPSRSCAIWAAKHGSLSTMKLAFANGADMKTIDANTDECQKRGENSYGGPLHFALLNNFKDLAVFLLDKGARLDVPSYKLCECNEGWRDHYYPLHYAIRHSDSNMLSRLLERGAYESAKGVPGLCCAIFGASHSALDALLQQDSFDPDYRDIGGFTPLFYVVGCEDPVIGREMASKLVDLGVPLDVIGEDGGTALSPLIAEGRFKPAIELLERGANPTLGDWGDRGIDLMVDCLKSEYSDAVDRAEPESKARDMREDRRKLLSLILAGGVDPDRRMGHGAAPFSRPLFWALMGTRDAECVRILLDAGADIKYAFIENHESRSESLLRVFFELFHEADPNALQKWTRNTLGLEPFKGSVRLLLERGARIDSLDGEWSALNKTCELATSDMGTGPLELLVENATCKNIELEHVEHVRGDWAAHESVSRLLGLLYDRLTKERETGISGCC